MRKRRFSRSRRRRSTGYEMQYAPFDRVSVVMPGGSSFADPTVHLFLICHPRLEYTQGASETKVPAIERGCIVKGMHFALQFGYLPPIESEPTSSAIGAQSFRWAIQRLPTGPDMTPVLIPNLFQTTISSDVSIPWVSCRTLWNGFGLLGMVDGSVGPGDVSQHTIGDGIIAQLPRTPDWGHSRHIKTSCRLSMDQGIFLNVQGVSPFVDFIDIAASGFSMSAFFRYGVKRLTGGKNEYP